MYDAYRQKNDSPVIRTFMYMTLVLFFILGSILIFLEKILVVTNLIPFKKIYNIKHSSVFWGLIIMTILFSTYIFFSKHDFHFYHSKFSGCDTLNKRIKIWMLIAFPFLVFIFSLFFNIFLFGGAIFGKQLQGVFP